MKLIISIFILTIGAFAQNTKYKDGTDCECDSIVVTNTVETIKMVIQMDMKLHIVIMEIY